MRYIYELTVPANTLEADPEILEIQLVKGTLDHVEIAYPPGPANMVYVVIKNGILQVSPINPDRAHHWDNYTEKFSLNYPLTDPFPLLQLVGWSPDTTYPHIITFRLDVSPVAKDGWKDVLQHYFGGGKS